MDAFDILARQDSGVAAEIEDLAIAVLGAAIEVHRSQSITYLKLKRLPLALLINFNVTILRDGVKRVIDTQ